MSGIHQYEVGKFRSLSREFFAIRLWKVKIQLQKSFPRLCQYFYWCACAKPSLNYNPELRISNILRGKWIKFEGSRKCCRLRNFSFLCVDCNSIAQTWRNYKRVLIEATEAAKLKYNLLIARSEVLKILRFYFGVALKFDVWPSAELFILICCAFDAWNLKALNLPAFYHDKIFERHRISVKVDEGLLNRSDFIRNSFQISIRVLVTCLSFLIFFVF